MIDLKFFYTIELNFQHPEIQKSKLYREFYAQKWVTFVSEEFSSDAKCVKELKKFMKEQTLKFKEQGAKVKCSFEVNPILALSVDELDSYDGEYDENALVLMEIKDKNDWLLKGEVTIFGRDLDTRLH